ncbi:3-oxoacid CoA-transferase subunit B [Micromonospora sp. U21]|uniref:3-oxoacid CoA-transferase subunit B n=1 Tax=Micromonospora sp. U21 TaxID=2824899 RepID=UPI001B39CAED|nr:3-oxoacid CoA-transferase subunit B [Micromonospora sp. U21]MBQ0905010.1 3-oxoacid CoA-transferase subunit B [Micromonospora sp. U21]
MPRERIDISRRVAADIGRGWSVNLGIGIPTLCAQFIAHPETLVQSENGILGMGGPPPPGQEDPDLVDAGKRPATIVPGGCFFDSLMSFGLIRGGHLDLAVLGAFQVGANGDVANWRLPHKSTGALGGAADLAAGARRVWVAMEHVGKGGEPRLLRTCSYPLTARGVVGRVYTDLAVLEPRGDGRFEVIELAEGVSFNEVQERTDAELVAATAAETPRGEHARA